MLEEKVLEIVVGGFYWERRGRRVAIFYERGRETDNFQRREKAISDRISESRTVGRLQIIGNKAQTNGLSRAIWLRRAGRFHANSITVFTPQKTGKLTLHQPHVTFQSHKDIFIQFYIRCMNEHCKILLQSYDICPLE